MRSSGCELNGSMNENRSQGRLLPYQQKAVEHIQERATRAGAKARNLIDAVLARARLNASVYVDAMESVRTRGRVALHFHPERLHRGGGTVAAGLLEAGVYKSQFETGL